jgi:non-lysosomal glucosylceramidase
MQTKPSTEWVNGEQRWFDSTCREAAFLIGGIGTGNFSIGARGDLRDWELFGTPGKGNYLPDTFFAIWVKPDGDQPITRVLEGPVPPPFAKSHGFNANEFGGLPRFSQARLKGEYPFVTVELSEPGLPLAVSLEAFTPFIPLNADDSGIPTGILRYRVCNKSAKRVQVAVAGSLCNMTTLKQYNRTTWKNFETAGEVVNEIRDEGTLRGLFYHPKTLQPTDRFYGTMALTTRDAAVTYKRAWLNGGWWDGLQDFWNDFSQDGRLESESAYTQLDAVAPSPDRTASLAIRHDLLPGEERIFEFQISWHFPNRVNSWSSAMYQDMRKQGKKVACCPDGSDCDDESGIPTMPKYYAGKFADAWDAARYTLQNLGRLEDGSRKFHRALFSSTLPPFVIDAIAANITVIRSPTCFRLADGTLMAWEGCFDEEGCCEGNCTHVFNYAQTMAFLFPELERSMRKLEYQVETTSQGKMNFRSYLPFEMDPHDHMPAADGQLGTIVRLYREWKFSGDDEFLKSVWGPAARSLDFAFEFWDRDGDFVLDTDLFNTYDIAFQGPSSMINSIFLAALLAGAEMAEYLGEPERAARYREAFRVGGQRVDEMLWGGEYYVQKSEDIDRYRYQYGLGCLSDQLLGQTWAHLVGLGYVLPKEHVQSAAASIFKHNFLETLHDHTNPQRTYALNNEKGLVLCTWPDGDRPSLPFPYSDEVWTGIEYHVATHLVYEDRVDEALRIVAAVRERHDGVRRNPWNEVECGHHYMRSLASYGLLVALSGFEFDLPRGRIAFHPKIQAENFQCFFSTGKCWGIYRQSTGADGKPVSEVEVLYGSMEGVRLS